MISILMFKIDERVIYISEWHDNFANHIGGLLSFVETLLIQPYVTDKDKQALDEIKMILNGKDAKDIEQTLAKGIVKQDTLDKIGQLLFWLRSF